MGPENKDLQINGSKPWVILVERQSANGSRSVETMTSSDLDAKLSEFLRLEAEILTKQTRRLEKKMTKASESTSHGRKRSGVKIKQKRESLDEVINRLSVHREILSGQTRNPIKIVTDLNGEAIKWEFPSGDDAIWATFVKNERPDILRLSGEDCSLIYRGFLLRQNIVQNQSGAIQNWQEFLREEIGDRDDLIVYLVDLTKRYGKPKER